MPGSYRYVLEERAVEALVSASETGRKNFADMCGPFTVAHWMDHAVREVRVLEFRRS